MSEKAISISDFFGSAAVIDARTAKVAKEAGQAAAKELRRPFYERVRLGEFSKHSLTIIADTRELHIRETTISRRMRGFRNDAESLPKEYGLKILFSAGELVKNLARTTRSSQESGMRFTNELNLYGAELFDITYKEAEGYKALALPIGIFKINRIQTEGADDVIAINVYPNYKNKDSRLFLPSNSVARMEGNSGSLRIELKTFATC